MTRSAVATVIGSAVLFASPAVGATFVNGSPDFASLRGKPTTIMFFHPL